MKSPILAAALLLAAATPAAAYTSYLLPEEFWATDDEVSIEAAFASEFFTPEIALSSEFAVLRPDGSRLSFDRVAVAHQATTLETDLPAGGTYRITSGERLGRVATMVATEDGQWRELPEGELAPPDLQTTTLQTVTLSDVYVTRGVPTRDVVDQPLGRLALHPITHPNQILAAQGFEVEVLFDNQPFANIPVVIYDSGDADTDISTYVVTNEQGRAQINLPTAGQYLIAVRHRAEAPAGAEAAVQSYTTTLTFQAFDALPEQYDVAEREAEEAREQRRRERRPARRRVGRPDY